LDDRRRDGGTNSTLRTKEQGTHLTLNERDDDDDILASIQNRKLQYTARGHASSSLIHRRQT